MTCLIRMFLFTLLTTTSLHSKTHTLDIGNEATIPCFDMRQLQNASNAERLHLIQAFGNGLRDVGFVAIYAPEATPLVEKATAVMKEYFAQDYDLKMKDWHNNNGQSGFSFKGLETAAGSKTADIKETYFIIHDIPTWPETPESFKTVMSEYLDTLSSYSDTVMSYLWEYLGEEVDAVENNITSGSKRIRLAYYPQPKKEDDPRALWAAAHQDLNAITLLPRPSRSGLQLKTKEGKWLPVTVPKDYIIINCGDQITRKTAGYIQGTEHRVINEDKENSNPRYSSILFSALPDEYSLKPFPNCAKWATAKMSSDEAENYLNQFTDVTVMENLVGRLIEMGAWNKPTEELINNLRAKGLINNPCDSLKEQFPEIFTVDSL